MRKQELGSLVLITKEEETKEKEMKDSEPIIPNGSKLILAASYHERPSPKDKEKPTSYGIGRWSII